MYTAENGTVFYWDTMVQAFNEGIDMLDGVPYGIHTTAFGEFPFDDYPVIYLKILTSEAYEKSVKFLKHFMVGGLGNTEGKELPYPEKDVTLLLKGWIKCQAVTDDDEAQVFSYSYGITQEHINRSCRVFINTK